MTKKSPRRRSRQPTRKQLSRREKERRTRQALIIGTSIVIGLVVLILGWGVYDQYVLQPKKPVATVAGVPIRLDTYQKMVKYRRWDYRNYLGRLEDQKRQFSAGEGDQSFLLQYVDRQIQQVQGDLLSLPTTVLDDLIDDQIVRQECQQRGIIISPEQVQLRLEEQFGYDRNPPTPTPVPITATLPITVTPTPTIAPMTHEQFVEQSDQWFQIVQETTRFTEGDFRHLLEGALYREKLEEILNADVPTTAEQINARHILVETREEAEDILARLGSGEDFEDLAAELSQDESNKDTGGDLGWFAHGRMVPEFDEAAFALQPGELSDVVETQFGFHIIRLDERDLHRELDEATLIQAQREAVDKWFQAKRQAEDIVRSWDVSMVPKEATPRAPVRR